MKRTNEMIFADIRANGFMTERDMKLLKIAPIMNKRIALIMTY